MLEALHISPTDKVLEVGTGSGYVTALLAELAAQAVSIERHASLAESARVLLSRFGYTNVKLVTGDGIAGYPEFAPYDVIIVSAAAVEMPQSLVAQLAEGGRMIMPVGSEDSQQLRFVRKVNGQLTVEFRELCRFVPLVQGLGS
jgi:protein-L-isoaspartate(D-aspartate) O-methyltransferase